MSQIVSALSSLVVTVPLIAVPCLAVFGLPSIGPANAGAGTEETVQLDDTGSLGTASAEPAKSFPPIVDASNVDRVVTGSGSAGIPPNLETTSDHRVVVPNRALGLEDPKPSPPQAKSAGPKSFEVPLETPFRRMDEEPESLDPAGKSDSADGWETYAAELTALGVGNFRLMDGEVPGEAYFTCVLREGGRVIRRFEAEAASPAAAAAEVLSQVKACRGTR